MLNRKQRGVVWQHRAEALKCHTPALFPASELRTQNPGSEGPGFRIGRFRRQQVSRSFLSLKVGYTKEEDLFDRLFGDRSRSHDAEDRLLVRGNLNVKDAAYRGHRH